MSGESGLTQKLRPRWGLPEEAPRAQELKAGP